MHLLSHCVHTSLCLFSNIYQLFLLRWETTLHFAEIIKQKNLQLYIHIFTRTSLRKTTPMIHHHSLDVLSLITHRVFYELRMISPIRRNGVSTLRLCRFYRQHHGTKEVVLTSRGGILPRPMVRSTRHALPSVSTWHRRHRMRLLDATFRIVRIEKYNRTISRSSAIFYLKTKSVQSPPFFFLFVKIEYF